MAAEFPPAKRRRTTDESGIDEEGGDATRDQVVRCFIAKASAIRSQEDEKLLVYIHDDNVSIMQDVLDDLRDIGIKSEEQLSVPFIWNSINLQLAAIAELRLLYDRLRQLQREQDLYSVLGMPHTKIESLKGVNVAQLLETTGDELWEEFRKHEFDSLYHLRQARKAQLRRRTALMLDAYHLEALCGVVEFCDWGRRVYQHNPFEFFNRIGSISHLVRRQLIMHLSLSNVPINCSYAAGHLAVVVKCDSKGLTTTGGLWARMHTAFQKEGFVFVSSRDERMQTVCAQAATQGLAVLITRNSSVPERFKKYCPVLPSEQWIGAYLSGDQVFASQLRLRQQMTVQLQAALAKVAEAVLEEILSVQRREELKNMKGVMLLPMMPRDRHFLAIQNGLQSDGIALVCTSPEVLPLYKAFLPTDILIDETEATYEDLGIKHHLLRGLNLEWIATLRKATSPASTHLPKLLTPFTSISAAEENIPEVLVSSAPEAQRWVEKEEQYFRMDIPLPFSMPPITSRIFSTAAKEMRYRFEQKLMANVKLAMTEESGGRMQCQQFARIAMGRCNQISDSDLLCHALQVLRKQDKVVLLCYDAPDDPVYALHPLKKSDFPKVFLFKSTPHTPMQLEEYMAGIAFLGAIVRRRLVQKQETRLWLLGKNARSFAKAVPFAAATWSEVIVERQLKSLGTNDTDVIEKCAAFIGKDGETEVVPQVTSQFLPEDFSIDVGKAEQQDLFARIDFACMDLLQLDQQFPRSVPAEYPHEFIQALDEPPSLTLLQWILVRLVPINDGYNGGTTWTRTKTKRAEGLYKKIRETSLAYHASALAISKGLPSLLNVKFESLAEVEATVERLAQLIEVLKLRPPWRVEPMWAACKPLTPDTLIKTFRNSPVDTSSLKCRQGGPAAGYEAKFLRSHYLDGSHIRYLYQTYFTSQWEAPPILYGILFHHSVRCKRERA